MQPFSTSKTVANAAHTGPAFALTAFAFTAWLTASASGQTFSTLPPNGPTATAARNTLPAPIAATPTATGSGVARHRARVTYTSGLLDVQANNSSLNGILRDIAHATGMKITGGVAEQRVFGNYGPADPSTVLATLLDGTGSNMLLRETAANGPAELILTPRTGGSTPPSPDSGGFEQDPDDNAPPQPALRQAQPAPVNYNNLSGTTAQAQPTTSGPQPIPQPFNNVLGSSTNTTPTASSIPTVNSVPLDTLSTPSTAQPGTAIVDSTNPPPPGSTTFGSSVPTDSGANAARTPEQIMQQLLALQKAAQQQQAAPGSTVPVSPANPTVPQPQ